MNKRNKKLEVMMWISICMAAIALVTFCTMSIFLYNKSRNSGTFDSLTFSSYESEYEEYSFLSNYEFFYCYGDVKQGEIDEVLPDFPGWFPNTFPQFLEEGGVIILTDDIPGMALECFNIDKDNFSNDAITRGFFKSVNNRPVICINLSKPADYDSNDIEKVLFWLMEASNAPIHEMAHYIDHKNGYSETDEFMEYFSRYATDYEPKSAVTKGYQATDEKEFFAVLYTDVLRNSNNENFIIPNDLKEFMLKTIDE